MGFATRSRQPAPPLPHVQSAPREKRRFAFGLFLVSAVLGLSVGGGWWAWCNLGPLAAKDTALVLIGATYDDNLAVPMNLHGWQGLQDLASLARQQSAESSNRVRLIPAGEVRDLRTLNDGDIDLDKIHGKNLVVAVSLHGGADRKGAYLLPATAMQGPDAEANAAKWRLEDLLARIKHQAHHRPTLLVVEAAQLGEHATFGSLGNGFARALESLNQQILDIPNLIVLSAADVDQRAWGSDHWKQSVFSHYLIEGLKGAAETEPRDGQISAQELFHYLSTRVDRWAQTQRGAKQTPVLLPRGDAGSKRAREMIVTSARHYSPPDARQLHPWSPPGELMELWQQRARLEKREPSPARYHPQAWRQHQECLMRLEECQRIGNSASALVLRQKLQEAEAKLQLDIPVAGLPVYSLAVLAAQGQDGPLPQWAKDRLDKCWQAEPNDRPRRLQELTQQCERHPGLSLRWAMLDWILTKVLEAPAEHLDRAGQLVEQIDAQFATSKANAYAQSPPPAETHFLMMARRDLSVLAPSDLFRQALALRIEIERASLGLECKGPGCGASIPSEELAPWVRETLDQADIQRRLGQDLLFAGEIVGFDRARSHFNQAEHWLKQAEELSRAVRLALAQRDRLAATLPFATRWLAALPARAMPRALAEAAHAQLCQDFHQLEDLLEHPGPQKLPTILTLVDRLTLAQLALDEQAVRCSQECDIPQATWWALDALTHMPGLSTDLRRDVLTRRHVLGLSLESQLLQDPEAMAGVHVEEPPVTRLCRLGQLHLELLGKRWFNECGGELESFDQVKHRLNLLRPEGRWWDSALIAGEEIGLRWQRLSREARRLMEAADRAPRDQALAPLERAARWSRAAMGDGPVGAAHALAKWRWSALLVAQAERVVLDRWHGTATAREPYYCRMARELLDEAQRICEPRAGNLSRAWFDLDRQIRSAEHWEIVRERGDTAGPLAWTSEDRLQLSFRLNAPEGIEGIASWWIEPGQGLTEPMGNHPAGNYAGQRHLHDLRPGKGSEWSCQLKSPWLESGKVAAGSLDTHVTAHGYFRGRSLKLATPIRLHSEPQLLVVQHPMPYRSGVAVRASADSLASIGQLEQVRGQRLRYWIDRDDFRPLPGYGEAGLDVASQPGMEQWLPGGLAPGSYKVRVQAQHRLSRDLFLRPADLLLMEVVPGQQPGELDLKPVNWSRTDYPFKPAVEKGPWRLALLQNQRIGEHGLQLLTTLERRGESASESASPSLEQRRPGKIWFEVSAAPVADRNQPSIPIRWHELPGYPASAWSIDSTRWPASASPILAAWWSAENNPAPQVSLTRGLDVQRFQDLVGRTLSWGDDSVVVESANIEEQAVECLPARPEGPAKRMAASCLVVRVRHAPGKPIWLKVNGMPLAGSEQRYYGDADQVTCVFWPVTADDLEKKWRSLEVLSVASFKRDAEAKGCHAMLDRLYEPNPAERRPPLLVDLERSSSEGDPRVVEQTPGPFLLPAPPSVVPAIPIGDGSLSKEPALRLNPVPLNSIPAESSNVSSLPPPFPVPASATPIVPAAGKKGESRPELPDRLPPPKSPPSASVSDPQRPAWLRWLPRSTK